MAIIKKFASYQNLTNFQVFQLDKNPKSDYFRITELDEILTGGKNGFLIEGSEYLKETTEIKIEILDVEGNPIYYEPGDGIPEYYEGTSKLVSVHIYDDTPIGIGKITILGELKNYIATDGSVLPIPDEWKDVYNVKWETEFQINKLLPNETRVRFYKRPLVTISEIVKPIFERTLETTEQTGSVRGFAIDPPIGQKLSDWRAGTNYLLELTSGSWDIDIDEDIITISVDENTTFSPRIIDVIDDSQAIVNIPFTDSNGNVANFNPSPFTASYSDFKNEVINESSITGSFAKIDITQLKTFVGDVARVKIFRKSRNAVGDFAFVQEAKLESQELLRDVTTLESTEVFYGKLVNETLLATNSNGSPKYWVTSSADHRLYYDTGSVLRNSAHIDYNTTAGGTQKLFTSSSLSISKDVEYTLKFNALLSSSDDGYTSDKNITAYLSSSDFTETFVTISGSASPSFNTSKTITRNLISQNTGDAKLVFEIQGDDWFISNISLRNAQDTSFSPDEFLILQDIPRKTATEIFDFKFEFYDVNNNFIPVDVRVSKEFDGGNDFPTSGKLLTFEGNRSAFRFSSGSFATPPKQTIKLSTTTQNLTGDILITSQAFDVGGNLITSQSYHDSGALVYGSSWTGSYPGFLTSRTPASALLTIANFSGSLDTPTVPSESVIRVDNIVYTASLDGLEEFETILRFEDGDNAPDVVVTSTANQFTYEPTSLSPKPASQTITLKAKRRNLGDLVKTIRVASRSDTGVTPPELTYVDTVRGTDTYTLSATAFSQSFAHPDNFDSATYEFTSSDEFGNQQDGSVTITKVINFDAVSLVLSNESTSFPAKSTGEVTGGFAASSGSVQMFVGNVQITHDDYDSDSARNRNTFDIKTITESNVTASSTSPTNEFYSITGFDTNKDSGSLTLNIEYLAGDNSTSQSFQKVVSYTKSKKAVPTVLTKVSPSTQTINSSSLGFETPQTMEVVVQEGGDEYTYDAALGSPNTFHINSLGYTAGSASFDDEIITLFTDSVGDGSGAFITSGLIGSASIDYKNSEGTEVYDKIVRFDLSVSKIGVDGVNGASGSDAKVVSLTSTKYAIVYDGDGNLFPASQPFTLSGSAQNFDDPRFQFLENGSQIQGFSTDSNVVIPTAGNLPTAGGTNLYEVRVKENGGSVEAFDNIDVFGVQSGSDAFTVFLTNEAHSSCILCNIRIGSNK